MSTKGAIGESFFLVRLIIVLALLGAVAGFVAGNRVEWTSLSSAQIGIVHQFEIGAVLTKLKACGIPKAPHWIIQRCKTYSSLIYDPAARDYLIAHMRRALILWPAGMAIGGGVLGIIGLALKSARFKKLDAHEPRDYFKRRRLAEFLDWFSLALIPFAIAAGWLFQNRTVLLASAVPVLALAWLRPWHKRRKLKHVRGAKIEDAEDVERLIRKHYKKRLGGLEIGGVPIPRDFEVLNFLVVGAPGTGKSTAITPMISAMRERGDRVFCADARGDYLKRFYRPGDLILNPLDQRAVEWSPLAEIHNESDAAAIARSLIPDGIGKDANWHELGQTMLDGVLQHAKAQDLRNADIARLMLSARLDELHERLDGTIAAGLLPEKSDSPAFHSIRVTVSPYMRSMSWLAPNAGSSSFSLRAWARDESSRAACWFAYEDAQIVGLRTLIATQFDLLSLGILEQPDSRDRRTWLIVDELPALGKISSIQEFLARARKSGGAAVLGVQSLSQLQERYGPLGASVIIGCSATLLALALGDAETQEYVSKLLGEQEQSVITRSSSQSDAASQQTVQRALRTERVLMPSELSPGQLKSMHGFLRLPELPIAPVKLRIFKFKNVAPQFVPREGQPASEPAPAETSPPAPADASPAALLEHLEAQRQACWSENQKQDAAEG